MIGASVTNDKPEEDAVSNISSVNPKTVTGGGKTSATSGAGQVVVVFQGGGALGAFQAGVYHALHEAGVEPDWVIGTSIGAINAALIAGNDPSNRVAALHEFWNRVVSKSHWAGWPFSQQMAQAAAYLTTLSNGIPGFFSPNPYAFLGPHVHLGADNAGYYSTASLEKTLTDLVDFSAVGRNKTRLTVGAAQVRTSQMRYFDSRETEIGVKHILASGALPPAFPAVRIDGELYWDGGILSNTPTEAIFDDKPRRSSLVFAVHMWNPVGPEPETIWQVLHRQKDIQYSSRVATHVARQAQIHRLRHVIRELVKQVPEAQRSREDVRELAAYGCATRMHVVRLLWPGLAHEDHTKDLDLSATGIRNRWQAGYDKAMRAIELAPWRADVDPIDGVYLHEFAEMENALAPSPEVAPKTHATMEIGEFAERCAAR